MNLATKYRPKNFDEVVGQPYTIQILKNQIKTNNVKPSYLFVGSSGCGKTTVARIFANSLIGGSTIIEIDAASNNGVDTIREIIEDTKHKSLGNKYRVYILDEAHLLSVNAWNALLKTLEEAPEGVVFILCTTDPQKILPTIFSRSQRFNFNKIEDNLIINRLAKIAKEENISATDKAISLIVSKANGGMRMAIALLEQCFDYVGKDTITEDVVCNLLTTVSEDDLKFIINSTIRKDKSTLINTITDISNFGVNMSSLTEDLLRVCISMEKSNFEAKNGSIMHIITGLLYALSDMKYAENKSNILIATLLRCTEG